MRELLDGLCDPIRIKIVRDSGTRRSRQAIARHRPQPLPNEPAPQRAARPRLSSRSARATSSDTRSRTTSPARSSRRRRPSSTSFSPGPRP